MLKDILDRLRRGSAAIDVLRGLIKSPQKKSVDEFRDAISRARNSESGAVAEIERLVQDRPRALLESDDELKALDETIAAAERLRDRSRAVAEALAAPLAAAEAEEEEARRQTIREKGRAAVAAYEKTLVGAYPAAHAALASLIEAARDARRARIEWVDVRKEDECDLHVPGYGLFEAVRAIEKTFKELPTPDRIKSYYLAGGPEKFEIEWLTRRSPEPFTYTPRQAEFNQPVILDAQRRDVSVEGTYTADR